MTILVVPISAVWKIIKLKHKYFLVSVTSFRHVVPFCNDGIYCSPANVDNNERSCTSPRRKATDSARSNKLRDKPISLISVDMIFKYDLVVVWRCQCNQFSIQSIRGVYPPIPWCVPPRWPDASSNFLIIMHLKCCADKRDLPVLWQSFWN